MPRTIYKCPRCGDQFTRFGEVWRCFYLKHTPALRVHLPNRISRPDHTRSRWVTLASALFLLAGCRSGENQTVTGAGYARPMPPLPPSMAIHRSPIGTPHPVMLMSHGPQASRNVTVLDTNTAVGFFVPFQAVTWNVNGNVWTDYEFKDLPAAPSVWPPIGQSFVAERDDGTGWHDAGLGQAQFVRSTLTIQDVGPLKVPGWRLRVVP